MKYIFLTLSLLVTSQTFASYVPKVICGNRDLVINTDPHTRNRASQFVLKNHEVLSYLRSRNLLSSSEGNDLPSGEFISQYGEFLIKGSLLGYDETFRSVKMNNGNTIIFSHDSEDYDSYQLSVISNNNETLTNLFFHDCKTLL